MISNRHIPGWPIPHKRVQVNPWKLVMVGTATIVMLSYLSVALVCARTDGMHIPPSGVKEIALSTTAPKAPVPDSDEELCKFMHEQMLALQASPTGSIVLAKISHLDVLIGEDIPHQTVIFDAFRPPGNRCAPTQLFSSQLYSVLRI